ncbi:MAG: DEAD/DEAH box helicase family protein [Syntrophales bacterium]
MTSPVINVAALEPLFAPHEEPDYHRVRADRDGDPAKVVRGRRPTTIVIAQNLRFFVKAWRESDYPGASDTTRELLHHWFERDHLIGTTEGDRLPFRYYFCQREAIETIIYLHEVRQLTTLSGIMAEFGGEDALTAALGVNPDDDRWPKYAFKVATGAGKTKVMSLAIVWSYFHALRESDSSMAQHFVVIAPNLTVFERLKEDFRPEKGGLNIFDRDPLIPVAWRGDWNLSVVPQDQAGGAATGGTLYLTNIHRLYDSDKRRRTREDETYEWMGPLVSRAKALDTGEVLRKRITAHARVMILNDEAHHLWDPGSAWNEAISFLHETIACQTEGGIAAQLDFSATPKDNSGRIFQHVVCDTPLGEAVDAGIVKTPIIGRGQGLIERPSQDAAEKYQQHLMIGYERWRKSKEEWQKSGKKPLLFVMTEDTESADQIARRLDTDPLFGDLNGRTVNLHTRLKGKIKWVGGRKKGYPVFEEGEKEINDEDLKELRKLSRELDSGESPYQCIVSVLMLREGWDVRNVTTIVPLRSYTSKANILPEQTLGRGLRRMDPTGTVAELVTIVEHSAFVSLYQEQLSQEGLPIEVVDVEDVPKTTVTIFPDREHKDCEKLDIVIPPVTPGYSRKATIEGLALEDIRKQFSRYQTLPLGEARPEDVQYEGRHLFTNEVIEEMKIRLPLLESGIGAVSFYREELEHISGLRGTHRVLAPLIETFLTELLFKEKVSLFDERLLSRLADADVREHIRATFVPLILAKTTIIEERKTEGRGISLTIWKPFQVTHSAHHPAVPAEHTLFNLVPCNRELEVAMTQFLDRAPDVSAFCKNAGPQALRIDYLTEGGRQSSYTPDFIIRMPDSRHVLCETKGRTDRDVPLKARAAVSWCKAATRKKIKWQYLYVPQGIFEGVHDNCLETLIRTCEPTLNDLIRETVDRQLTLPFGEAGSVEESIGDFIPPDEFECLPSRYQKGIEQAVTLFRFLERKTDVSYAPVFTPLLGPLDEAARGVILRFIGPDVPEDRQNRKAFFEPDLSHLPANEVSYHQRQGNNLRRTLMDNNGLMPIGLLRWCLDYAHHSQRMVGGVFQSVKMCFAKTAEAGLFEVIDHIYAFRNEYIAHQDRELSNTDLARQALAEWIQGLYGIWKLHQ